MSGCKRANNFLWAGLPPSRHPFFLIHVEREKVARLSRHQNGGLAKCGNTQVLALQIGEVVMPPFSFSAPIDFHIGRECANVDRGLHVSSDARRRRGTFIRHSGLRGARAWHT